MIRVNTSSYPISPAIQLDHTTCNDPDGSVRREWLVTNGIGGYAMGTVSGLRTRSYHGLLIAALDPPLGRSLMLANLEETLTVGDITATLFTNSRDSGDISPDGYRSIEMFRLERTTPVWTYACNGARIEKRIWMQPGENTTYIRYTLLNADDPVSLDIGVIVNYRDHHARSGDDLSLHVEQIEHGFRIATQDEQASFHVLSNIARTEEQNVSQEHSYLSAEAARGLSAQDTGLRVGAFHTTLNVGDSFDIVASTDESVERSGDQAYHQREQYEADLISKAPGVTRSDSFARQLVLAADQFIVKRTLTDGSDGCSVIAGYPWFGDWGRDTMISLPGLLIETGRTDLAAKVLRTFARYVDKGMLPNRFPDAGDEPVYNTVDATLWYFQAIRAYHVRSGDDELVRELFPVLEDIIDWHIRGTRHQIHVDSKDQLLYAGEPGTQLTWMDAKCGDWVVTPRIGKPVEVNALWYNALKTMADFARVLHRTDRALRYESQADAVGTSFSRFWNEATEYCFDVIDGPNGDEALLRPNQLFAVSLPHSPLSESQQKSVVDACEQSLLTPFGLRSLSQTEDGYIAHYEGDANQRDGAYHQGTVWAWLIGPFVDAHLRTYDNVEQAKSYLEPLLREHLSDFGVGSISEIFDGDEPYYGRGCPEQAWSVAELLRVWLRLHDKKPTSHISI